MRQADGYGHANAHADRDAHGDGGADPHRHAHTDQDQDAAANQDSASEADAHPDRDRDSDRVADHSSPTTAAPQPTKTQAGTLPRTGGDAGVIAALGGLLLAGGATLAFVARRRSES